MWDSSGMLGRIAAAACLVLALLAFGRPAYGWLETRVTALEARVEVEPSGQAAVEQRISVKINGNERFRELRVRGIDPDAVPAGNSYVVHERDAVAGSLDSAVPVTLRVKTPEIRPGVGPDPADGAPAPELAASVEDDGGLKRGSYVFVLRYRTDLRARGLVRRDGALVGVAWIGSIWEDGIDNARVTFVVPAAPTPPKADELAFGSATPTPQPDEDGVEAGTGPAAGKSLSEVRRGPSSDEIELFRSYLPKSVAATWSVRLDQRALDPVDPPAQVVPVATPVLGTWLARPPPRGLLVGVAALLFVLVTTLVAWRGREVARLAGEARAIVPPAVPLPLAARAPAAGLAVVGGVVLQVLLDRPLSGAAAVTLGAALAAHGAARLDPGAARRGPGQWLSVTEREALRPLPRLTGAKLDASTRFGKGLLLLLLAALGAASALLWRQAPREALLVALDSVVLLAIFGTGRQSALPPDLAVEPIGFFRKLVKRLRRLDKAGQLRVVPRIRIPVGGVDPDEMRLLVVPRAPLRGLGGIEVGLTYALGVGARVALPELLVRMQAGSSCEQALAKLAAYGRATPGRKPDERVITFAPRLPTVRMTAQMVQALATRVADRSAPGVAPEPSAGAVGSGTGTPGQPTKKAA